MKKLIIIFGIIGCLSTTFACTPVATENTENVSGDSDGTGSNSDGTGSNSDGTGLPD